MLGRPAQLSHLAPRQATPVLEVTFLAGFLGDGWVESHLSGACPSFVEVQSLSVRGAVPEPLRVRFGRGRDEDSGSFVGLDGV